MLVVSYYFYLIKIYLINIFSCFIKKKKLLLSEFNFILGKLLRICFKLKLKLLGGREVV